MQMVVQVVLMLTGAGSVFAPEKLTAMCDRE